MKTDPEAMQKFFKATLRLAILKMVENRLRANIDAHPQAAGTMTRVMLDETIVWRNELEKGMKDAG